MRTVARVTLGLALLAVVLSCGTPTASQPSPTPPPAQTPVAAQTPAAPTPAGRLPAVAAQLSFGLPGGDAYQPQAAAFDGAGHAVVLCYIHGQAGAASALVTIDPASGARGPVWGLPGRSFGPLAVTGRRAYLGYEDSLGKQHLAAVDLETGQVTADVASEFIYYADALVVDAAGHLYLPQRDGLEVRDATSLQVLRTLAYGGQPKEHTLAADIAHDRLYLAADERLCAYRASDLKLLWEATGLSGKARLVPDQAGRRVYAQCEAYQDGQLLVSLLGFDAATGQALGPVHVDAAYGWRLTAVSDTDRLILSASQGAHRHFWQTDSAGRPTGPTADVPGYAVEATARDGRLLVLLANEHIVRILDLASLRLLADVPTGVEIRNALADPAHGRAYVNDSAGRVHAVDTRTNRVLASVDAGRGPLALDAANGLLFVSREALGREVSVVTTEPLAVTATIAGGYRVAVDSAGRRAFVGWTDPYDASPGEVVVWDTRTFQRLATIAQRGEPAYNPLRDEVYLADYSAYIVDGKTLAVTGELTPDVSQVPAGMRGCNGCLRVTDITVDPALDVIAVSLTTNSTAGGPGSMVQPRLFSARTREPATHPATVLPRCQGGSSPFILPPDGGRVYEWQRFRRYVAFNATLAYTTGAATPDEWRDGLSLDLYVPGEKVGLSVQQGRMLAFDTTSWEPLGWLERFCAGEIDLAGRRIYAWTRAQLTVYSFNGGQALPAEPPEPKPAGQRSGGAGVQQIILSPDFAHDRTVFAIESGQLQRSTDGGASWSTLRGGLPPKAPGILPTLSLAVSPAYAQDHTLFAAGMAGEPVGFGVQRSTDGGDTWVPVWSGLQDLRVDRLVISPRFAQDRTLLAYCQVQAFWRGEWGTSLYRSTDAGASWVRAASRSSSGNASPLPKPEELLPLPSTEVQFKISEQLDAVQRSTDGGRTWQTVLARADGSKWPRAIVRSPLYDSDHQVFVLFEDLLYRSADGGNTWASAGDRQMVRTAFERHFTALAAGALGDGRVALFAGDYSGAVVPVDPLQLDWTPTAAPTPTPTPMPKASPTPCAPPAARMAAAYARWAPRLGCASGAGAEVQMASQRFEHGLMFWRADTREVYVLTTRDGANRWAVYQDTWQEGQPDRDPALQPPADREQPVRGFGKVWREALGGPAAATGWAVEGERGFTGIAQPFALGRLLSAADGRVYALLADGSWESE